MSLCPSHTPVTRTDPGMKQLRVPSGKRRALFAEIVQHLREAPISKKARSTDRQGGGSKQSKSQGRIQQKQQSRGPKPAHQDPPLGAARESQRQPTQYGASQPAAAKSGDGLVAQTERAPAGPPGIRYRSERTAAAATDEGAGTCNSEDGTTTST